MSTVWSALLELSGDAIILIDQEGRVTAASAAALRLFEHDHDTLLGLAIPDLLGCSLAAALGASEQQPISIPGIPGEFLLRVQTLPDGALMVIAPVLQPLVFGYRQRLHEISLAIAGGLDLHQTLRSLVRLAIELTGADAGSIPLYDSKGDRLIQTHVINLDDPTIRNPIHRGTGAIWEIIDHGRHIIINAYPTHPRAIPSLVATGVQAVLGVPLRANHETLGVLNLYHLTPGKQFSPQDAEMVEIMGQQAGIAIQNARLYQAALDEAERRHQLYAAGVEMGAALELEALYESIHRAIARLMRCDICVIGLYHEEREECEYVYCVDSQGRWPSGMLPIDRGMLGYVISHRLSLRITHNDPETEAMFHAEPFGEGEDTSRSIVATVLSVGDRVLGAISAQSAEPDSYSAGDLTYLEMLATTAAIAIQNARLFRQVQQLATVDTLTGVPNRRSFFTLATRELERAARYLKPLSVIMLDVDHFKTVNDTYGHLVGDQVLQGVARRCRESLRDVDVLARYGGEEFVILLPETGQAHALQVARRLQQLMNAAPIPTDAGPVMISISLGVASSSLQHPTNLDQLLDRADRAMYQAKRAGRNQVHG